MRPTTTLGAVGIALAAALAGIVPGLVTPVQAKDSVLIAVPAFLSGPAAGPFGVPARNGAEMVIDAINEGALPAPAGQEGPQRRGPVFFVENGALQGMAWLEGNDDRSLAVRALARCFVIDGLGQAFQRTFARGLVRLELERGGGRVGSIGEGALRIFLERFFGRDRLVKVRRRKS